VATVWLLVPVNSAGSVPQTKPTSTLLADPRSARLPFNVVVVLPIGLAGWLVTVGGTQLAFGVAGATGLAIAAYAIGDRERLRAAVLR